MEAQRSSVTFRGLHSCSVEGPGLEPSHFDPRASALASGSTEVKCGGSRVGSLGCGSLLVGRLRGVWWMMSGAEKS
jgi:hypothetical protein